MSGEVEYVTKNGLERAKAKLERLKARTREVGEIKSKAADGGDWHDNPVFEEMTREEYKLYREIAELEERIRVVEVVEPPSDPTRVEIGVNVRLEFAAGDTEEYRLVGSLAANPSEGRISYKSPLGSAILGAEIGTTVAYEVGDGREIAVRVVSVSAP